VEALTDERDDAVAVQPGPTDQERANTMQRFDQSMSELTHPEQDDLYGHFRAHPNQPMSASLPSSRPSRWQGSAMTFAIAQFSQTRFIPMCAEKLVQ